jgi:hypothetical protein
VKRGDEADLMLAAETRIVSDDMVVTGHSVVDDVVHLNGEPVLDAKGNRLRYRATCSVMCQWCRQNSVQAPMQVMVRFEPALGRRMYWQGIALSWEALAAQRCEKCGEADRDIKPENEPGHAGQMQLL